MAVAAGIALVAAVLLFYYLSAGISTGRDASVDQSHNARGLVTQRVAGVFVTRLDGDPAPAFRLTDQRGSAVGPRSFQGKTVVVSFLDPVCRDVCPVITGQFEEAGRRLEARGLEAEFVAVDANPHTTSSKALRTYVSRHGLRDFREFHFVTGDLGALRKVWRRYHATVEEHSHEVTHSSFIYVLDGRGRERYLIQPESRASIGRWAEAIEKLVERLST